jgi:hypothetical protein
LSDREDRPPSDDTIAFSGRGIGPPRTTAPIPVPERGPQRRRVLLLAVLLLLLGLAGGFAIAQFVGRSDDKVPDDELVLYEHALSTFPVDGAQFTRSAFDVQKRKCDPELLKRYLRADRNHRFEAWLDLEEISESQFDAFVDRLETRILSAPTPVTNYGCFADGEGPCPFSIQSVLGPGTPVWFDPQQNRIVAKCTCSSPIRLPQCPPNCEERPTPTPSPTPTGTPTASPTPTRTLPPPTPPPTPTPTQAPTPTPTPRPSPTPAPSAPATTPP